jgi:hypothetical protein
MGSSRMGKNERHRLPSVFSDLINLRGSCPCFPCDIQKDGRMLRASVYSWMGRGQYFLDHEVEGAVSVLGVRYNLPRYIWVSDLPRLLRYLSEVIPRSRYLSELFSVRYLGT